MVEPNETYEFFLENGNSFEAKVQNVKVETKSNLPNYASEYTKNIVMSILANFNSMQNITLTVTKTKQSKYTIGDKLILNKDQNSGVLSVEKRLYKNTKYGPFEQSRETPEKVISVIPVHVIDTATVEHAYKDSGSLSLHNFQMKKGDVLAVTYKIDDDWWEGYVLGNAIPVLGCFPTNYLKITNGIDENVTKKKNVNTTVGKENVFTRLYKNALRRQKQQKIRDKQITQNVKTAKPIRVNGKTVYNRLYNNALRRQRKQNTSGGGKKVVSKSVRKHQGIYQRGPKKGKLKPGYKYSGKKTKTGLKIIVKVK